MERDSQATTPGQDTTPYIRFAIDQLTRDEEVRGSRVYPQVRPTVVEEDDDDEDYPVERLVPDNGLGYMAQEQKTQQRMSQYMGQRQPSTRKSNTQRPVAQQQSQDYQTVPQQEPQQAFAQTQKDVFMNCTQSHKLLNFLPAILRPLSLGIFLILCLLMLAALIFLAIYSNRNGGEGCWDYIDFGDGRYFIFEYLPTILGMFLLMWLIQIQVALQRVMPFISMASDSFHQRSEAIFLQLHPMQFLLPNIQHFRAGHRRITICYVAFWLFAWTIPLLACSFNVRYDEDRDIWRWIAVQGVIWTVIVLYVLLVLALIMLFLFLFRNRTGLKWDPRSLADVLCLLERSNVTANYDGSETFQKGDWHEVSNRADRLGYWTTTRRPNDTFYGIGAEGEETRKFSVEGGRIKEKGPERVHPQLTRHHQQPSDFSIRMDIRDPNIRLRYMPWYLRDSSVIAWIVIACVLLVAFLVVSFVNSAVHFGFLPQVLAQTDANGFSASNFLYSFVPAVIGTFLFLAILSLDYSLRTLQPYMALSSRGGATAERSLLVDYACRFPVSVSLAAIENRDFQIALLSLVSLISVTLPILAGGCFWTQSYSDDEVRVAADLPGYYALCVFLVIYVVGILALIPNRRRAALPHRSNNFAEIISWVYQSPILADRAFARPQTKPELVARLMGSTYLERTWTRSVVSLVRPSRNNLRSDSPTEVALNEKKTRQERQRQKHDSIMDPGKIKYGFGIHVGRDGLEHLGIDRVSRGGDRTGRELVIWEEQQGGNSRRKSWSTEQV